MHGLQKQAFGVEILQVRQAITIGDYNLAYRHLERAHILGQRYVWPHTYTHLLFLVIGWKRRDYGEIIGQLARIPLGMLGSALGRVPTGNTGGANVSMFKTMPVPEDLQKQLNVKPEANNV